MNIPSRWRTRIERRLRPVLLLSAVALAVTSVPGCGSDDDSAGDEPSTTTTAPAVGALGSDPVQIDTEYTGTSGPRVAIVGDSLTLLGRSELFEKLSGYRVKIASAVGEGIGGGPWSSAFGSDLLGDATDDYLSAPEPPDILVIALGTNNAWQKKLTLDMFEAAWPEMVDDYRGSCLVVVTATETTEATDYDASEAKTINDQLEARADRVVDWPAVSREDYVQDDHIHLDDEGLEHRATLIADAVESCDVKDGPADPTPGTGQ